VLFNFNTGKDLVGLAFYDVGIYIVSLVSIKNYILVGDVYKSIFFLRWRVCILYLLLVIIIGIRSPVRFASQRLSTTFCIRF
jgi:hypothetical protein